MQGTFCKKVGTIELRFSSFNFLLFLLTETIVSRLFLFNFKRDLCKNHCDKNTYDTCNVNLPITSVQIDFLIYQRISLEICSAQVYM